MEAETKTEQKNDKLQILLPAQKPNAFLGWLTEQVTILAEAYGEPLTAARLRIYVADLADLERSQLETAFRRARRECKDFFPKIANLRELSGVGSQAQRDDVEAEAAFQSVIRSLEREGVGYGIRHLPAQTQYAVRQCGGLFMLNQRLQIRYGADDQPSQMDDRGPIFLQRDFVKAYKNYQVHQAMLPELTGKGIEALPPAVRPFLGVTSDKPRLKPTQRKCESPHNLPVTPKALPRVPESMTPAQMHERRALLRQQSETMKAKYSK